MRACVKGFFLGRLFLPVVAEIIGFREISEVPAKYRYDLNEF
jgi:hypothetical protein